VSVPASPIPSLTHGQGSVRAGVGGV
jgi:hypothetical protein